MNPLPQMQCGPVPPKSGSIPFPSKKNRLHAATHHLKPDDWWWRNIPRARWQRHHLRQTPSNEIKWPRRGSVFSAPYHWSTSFRFEEKLSSTTVAATFFHVIIPSHSAMGFSALCFWLFHTTTKQQSAVTRRDETGKLVGMFAPHPIVIHSTKEFFETISDESSLSSFARGGKVERRKTQPFSSPAPFFNHFSVQGPPSPRRFPARDEDLLKQYLILLKSDEAMRWRGRDAWTGRDPTYVSHSSYIVGVVAAPSTFVPAGKFRSVIESYWMAARRKKRNRMPMPLLRWRRRCCQQPANQQASERFDEILDFAGRCFSHFNCGESRLARPQQGDQSNLRKWTRFRNGGLTAKLGYLEMYLRNITFWLI